jgi:hypothetical protein
VDLHPKRRDFVERTAAATAEGGLQSANVGEETDMRSIRRALVVVVVAGCWFSGASLAAGQDNSVTRPFAAGGRVRMDLSAGAYTIQAGRDDQIHVHWTTTTPEEMASVKVDVQVRGTDADIVTSGPRNHFDVTIELPARSDLDTKLTAGDLRIRGVSGNKQVEMWAGNIDIEAGRPEDYGSVHASVTAGDLLASPFDARKGGLFRSLNWKGPGRYKLDVRLTAGDLRLR